MIFKTPSLLLAATLLVAPITTAIAQQNNPAGNQGSNRSITGSPGTADNPAASGMNTGDTSTGTSPTGNYSGSAANSMHPGATGQSAVPGSNSSVASTSSATREQQTGTANGK